MKIIGVIDIDGTITNLDFFKLTNKATILDANLNRFNIKIFRLILYKIVLLYSKNIKTRDNVKYALNELKNNNTEINFLTRRPFASENTKEGAIIKELIETSLIINDIPYDNIYYTNGNKLSECLTLNADFIIEDSPKNIMFLSNYLPVIVIDTPYNKGIYGKNIYRAKDWLEVPSIVLSICENKKSPKTLK